MVVSKIPFSYSVLSVLSIVDKNTLNELKIVKEEREALWIKTISLPNEGTNRKL